MNAFPDLDWLLDPVTVETFRRDFLEVRLLHLSNRSADRYKCVFSLADPEQILWSHEAQLAPSVMLLKQRERVSPPASSAGRLRAWVDAHYAEGATLLLPAVGRFVPAVAKLQRAVERFVGGHVSVNAYLTPAGGQGFEPHFDPHDIFVLQIAGTKNWRVFHAPVILPTVADARVVAPWELGEPVATPVLSPGDLLYLPRGMVHEARAQKCASLHLTIGFALPIWADVIEQCVREATRSSLALRRSIAVTPELVPELAAVIEALRAVSGRDELIKQALERMRACFCAGLEPLPPAEPGSYGPLRVRSADDYIERVPGMVAEVYTSGVTVQITFPGLGG